jgi:putative membrane protein
MRSLVKQGLLVSSIMMLVACGGDEPAKDPSAMNATPPPAPMPESKPLMDPKPVDSAMGGNTSSTTSPEPTPAKPAEKPLTDGEIVQVTSTANNGEIEMAQIAAKSATNADVKNFAAMMITQHRDMETKGKALATKAKITPADNDASTALKTDVASTVSNLKTQKGKDFDKAYMEAQVKAHRDVLNLFDNKLLPNAQNGDLKTLLTDARGHVASHLAKAEEIQGKLDTGAAAASKPADAAKPAPKK